jgi:hypothetical protein
MESGWCGIHDVHTIWPAAIVDWIEQKHGAADAYEALESTTHLCVTPVVKALAEEPMREIVETMAAYCRANRTPFEARAEAGHVTFVLSPNPYTRSHDGSTVSFATDTMDALRAATELLTLIR